MDYFDNEYDEFFTYNLPTNSLKFSLLEGNNNLPIQLFSYDQNSNEICESSFFIKHHKIKLNTPHIEKISTVETNQAINVSDKLTKTPLEELIQQIEINKQKKQKQKEDEQVFQKALQDSENQMDVEDDKKQVKKEKQLFVKKYMPKSFSQLLSDEKTNREALTWLKSWDPIVFGKKIITKQPKQQINAMFLQNANKDKDKEKENQNNNNKFQNNQFQKNTQFQNFYKKFDIRDEQSLEWMQNNVLLLAGPPGCGKTTLARIIADHCGYKAIEINASDERSSSKLVQRLETMSQNESIQMDQNTETKPTLIIFDEVDGAMDNEQAGSGQGAVDALLEYIFNGHEKANANIKKNKNKNDSKKKKDKKQKNDQDSDSDDEKNKNKIDEDDEEEEGDGKKKDGSKCKLYIKRPVIFICNNIYAKGLRNLRRKAITFNFQKVKQDNLVVKLKEICRQEKIPISTNFLNMIVQSSDNDIRQSLTNLEMVQKQKNRGISLQNMQILENECAKGVLQLLQDLIVQKKGYDLKNISFANQDLTYYTFNIMLKNIQPDQMLEALFKNYLKLTQYDSKFEKFDKIPTLLENLCLASRLDRNSVKYQYQMASYVALPLLYTGIHFQVRDKCKLEYPIDGYARWKKNQYIKDTIDQLLEKYPASDKVFIQKSIYIQEIASKLHQIIQPIIVNNIVNYQEKKDMNSALSIMCHFGIELNNSNYIFQYLPNKQKYQINFNPPIDRILIFSEQVPDQTINFRSKQVLQNNYQIIKDQKSRIQDLKEVGLEDQIKLISMDDNINKNKRQKKKLLATNLTYRHQEGLSIPIKYDLKMDFFFN